MFRKKSRFKPLYRKFLLYRGDVQKRSKIRRFKLKKKNGKDFLLRYPAIRKDIENLNLITNNYLNFQNSLVNLTQ
jgi:hypothetical protein